MIKHYRLDIDGLRAIAVLCVIFFHFNGQFIPSGFLGVDIFFAISGFVITGSLLNRPIEMGFRDYILTFYERRVRRIVPALALSTVIGAVSVSLFFHFPDWSIKTGVAAIFGVSNLYLILLSSDYFATHPSYNSLMHTWSLGVEEQFYLFFPLLVWVGFAFPFTKNSWVRFLFIDNKRLQFATSASPQMLLFVTLSVLSIVSYGLFVIVHALKPVWAFYLMPTRFWELAAGALAYLFYSSTWARFIQEKNFFKTISIALIPLIIVGSPLNWVLVSTPLVVLFTCILLISDTKRGLHFDILTNPVAVKLGRLSYSLYLFHWPVVVLATLTCGISLYTTPFLFIIIFALAYMSYRFVETPLRRSKWSKNPGSTLCIGAIISFVTCAFLFLLLGPVNKALFLGKLPNMEQIGLGSLITPYLVDGKGWSGAPCVLENNGQVGKNIDVEMCTLGDFENANRRVLVIGNSYTASFVHAFDDLVKDGFAVTITSSWGASVVPEIRNTGPFNRANDDYWQRIIPGLSAKLRENDWLFLMNDLSNFATVGSVASPDEKEQIAIVETGLRRLSYDMSQRGIHVAFLNGLPFARESKCAPEQAIPQWYDFFGNGRCKYLTKSETLERRSALSKMLLQLDSEGVLDVVELFDIFCPGTSCAYNAKGGELLYRDLGAHPSVEAARLSQRVIRDALNR